MPSEIEIQTQNEGNPPTISNNSEHQPLDVDGPVVTCRGFSMLPVYLPLTTVGGIGLLPVGLGLLNLRAGVGSVLRWHLHIIPIHFLGST